MATEKSSIPSYLKPGVPQAVPTVLGSARSNVGPGVHGGGVCAGTSPKRKIFFPTTQAPNFPGLWVQLTPRRVPGFLRLIFSNPTEEQREGDDLLARYES